MKKSNLLKLLILAFPLSQVPCYSMHLSGLSKKSHEVQKNRECLICFDEKDPKDFATLSCGHSYCKACLTELVQTALKGKSTENLKCSNRNCGQPISEADIRKITNDKSILSNHADVSVQEWISKQPGAKHCPTPDCKFAFLNENMQPQQITCLSCHKTYCSACLLPHSRQMSCRDAKDLREMTKDKAEKAQEIWERKNTRSCPRCKSLINKTEGCNHMTCRLESGGCGYEFCWICLKERRTYEGLHQQCDFHPEIYRVENLRDAEQPKLPQQHHQDSVEIVSDDSDDVAPPARQQPAPLFFNQEERDFQQAIRESAAEAQMREEQRRLAEEQRVREEQARQAQEQERQRQEAIRLQQQELKRKHDEEQKIRIEKQRRLAAQRLAEEQRLREEQAHQAQEQERQRQEAISVETQRRLAEGQARQIREAQEQERQRRLVEEQRVHPVNNAIPTGLEKQIKELLNLAEYSLSAGKLGVAKKWFAQAVSILQKCKVEIDNGNLIVSVNAINNLRKIVK